MAALQQRRARLLDALYDSFGEPARWTPAGGGAAVAVTVRRRGEDVDVGMGAAQALVWQDLIRVRRSEIAAASRGDQVEILDPETGATLETLRLGADPRLVKNGAEWACEVRPVRS